MVLIKELLHYAVWLINELLHLIYTECHVYKIVWAGAIGCSNSLVILFMQRPPTEKRNY